MFDTVRIKHISSPISDTRLKELGANKIMDKRRWFPIYALNPMNGDSLPRVTFTFPPNGVMHTSAEVSLAGMFFGHNAQLPTDKQIHIVLCRIGEYVREKTGQAFDPFSATVSRVDFAKDYHVGEAAANQIPRQLSNRILSRYTRRTYAETLYFESKGRTKQIRVYAKLSKVLNDQSRSFDAIDAARGNLRLEYSIQKDAVKAETKRLGLTNRTARTLLTTENATRVIENIAALLSFDPSAISEISPLDALLRFYPARKAWALAGFLQMLTERGETFYQDSSYAVSKRTFQECMRDCRRAKAWPKLFE